MIQGKITWLQLSTQDQPVKYRSIGARYDTRRCIGVGHEVFTTGDQCKGVPFAPWRTQIDPAMGFNIAVTATSMIPKNPVYG